MLLYKASTIIYFRLSTLRLNSTTVWLNWVGPLEQYRLWNPEPASSRKVSFSLPGMSTIVFTSYAFCTFLPFETRVRVVPAFLVPSQSATTSTKTYHSQLTIATRFILRQDASVEPSLHHLSFFHLLLEANLRSPFGDPKLQHQGAIAQQPQIHRHYYQWPPRAHGWTASVTATVGGDVRERRGLPLLA